MDISYIPMTRGFAYLAIALDGSVGGFCCGSCRSPWRRLSASRVGGAGQARQAGDLQHRPGVAVHGPAFTGLLIKNGMANSMDGKGAWRDNVFIERLSAQI